MPLLKSFDDALAADPPSGSSRPNLTVVGGSLSSRSIDWASLQSGLISHSHGLVSSVYRHALSSSATWPYDHSSAAASSSNASASDAGSDSSSTLSHAASSADGLSDWICIKRTSPDTQPRPHSISREIALLSTLSHRNVTPLLAAIHDTSDPFGSVVDLILPLYAASLEEVFEEPSLASLGESGQQERAGKSVAHLWSDSVPTFVKNVSSQLLEATAYLHENGVAHRDVKPSNILLSHTGVLKIIDLGTAYTTRPLQDALSPDSAKVVEEETKMVCQVGTGQFRAPELLFSPLQGYDAFAVDVWAVGVTLAHFFTSLVAVPRKEHVDDMPSLDVEDERRDWEKAFDSGAPLSPTSSAGDFWEEQEPLDQVSLPTTASGYIRTPLFAADRGDIGLAASIFELLGLPTDAKDWPEAEHFQPPLQRLPFAQTSAKGLLSAMPLFKQDSELRDLVHKVIVPAISLSAGNRPKASQLVATLQP